MTTCARLRTTRCSGCRATRTRYRQPVLRGHDKADHSRSLQQYRQFIGQVAGKVIVAHAQVVRADSRRETLGERTRARGWFAQRNSADVKIADVGCELCGQKAVVWSIGIEQHHFCVIALQPDRKSTRLKSSH